MDRDDPNGGALRGLYTGLVTKKAKQCIVYLDVARIVIMMHVVQLVNIELW